MTPTFYRLIVVCPEGGSRVRKIHISRLAVLILVAACLISFFATVSLMLGFPRLYIAEAKSSRLAAENRALEIETQDANSRLQNLDRQVAHVEEISDHIESLMDLN
jgi:hypothetical protein